MRRSERPPAIEELPIPDAVQHMNFAGDCRGNLGQVVGPMLGLDFDQYLTVVTEEYDPATDKTRFGLTYGDLSDRFKEPTK